MEVFSTLAFVSWFVHLVWSGDVLESRNNNVKKATSSKTIQLHEWIQWETISEAKNIFKSINIVMNETPNWSGRNGVNDRLLWLLLAAAFKASLIKWC